MQAYTSYPSTNKAHSTAFKLIDTIAEMNTIRGPNWISGRFREGANRPPL